MFSSIKPNQVKGALIALFIGLKPAESQVPDGNPETSQDIQTTESRIQPWKDLVTGYDATVDPFGRKVAVTLAVRF